MSDRTDPPPAVRSFPPGSRLLCVAALPVVLLGAADSRGVLRIEVGNVRAETGRVHVDVCDKAQFLKDCSVSGDAPAMIGATTVTVRGLRPGRYAVQAFYDQNGNGKVDRALFGIPKEGVGFSNDARIRMAPPKWAEAVFDYDGEARTIRLKLRYFIGPDAPRTR